MNNIKIHIFILSIIVPLLFSGCADDLYPKSSNNGSSDQMVETVLSFDFEVSGEEVRTRAEDFGSSTISTLWIGVYDTTTGNRVGSKEFSPSSSSGKIDLPVVYYDAHPEVVIVGVANYDLYDIFNDWTGTPIKNLLNEAETWNDFLNISLRCPEKDNAPVPDVSSNYNQIMMGVLSTADSGRPFLSSNGDGSVNISSNADCIVSLTDSKYGSMRPIEYRKVYLYRLYSQINVSILTGPNAEVSNVSYRRCHLPRGVYLAERPVYTGNTKNWSTWSTQTPNFADTQLVAEAGAIVNSDSYFSDDANNWIKAGRNNNFTFYQYENKHWGWDGSPYGHAEREKLAEGGNFPYSLGHQYNSFASYFIVRMTILDKSSGWNNNHGGKSAEIEYVIHQGNCNNNLGESYSDNGKDFCIFRNMIYNYKIQVNGLESIVTSVTTNQHKDDGMKGVVWKADIGSISTQGFTDGNPWGKFTLPKDHNNIVYRFYQGRGADQEPLDLIYGPYSKEELINLKGIYWPTIDDNTIVQQTSDCNLQQFYWFTDLSQDVAGGPPGPPVEYFPYAKNNPGNYRIHMEPAKKDPQNYPDEYKVGFYFYDPDESSDLQGSDGDECTYYTQNVCHVYEWKPAQLTTRLNSISPPESFSVKRFITQSITIDLNSRNTNSQYKYGIDYDYVIRLYNGNNRIGDDILVDGSLTYTLNLAGLNYNNLTYSVYAKAHDTTLFSDSYESQRGQISISNPYWDFDSYFSERTDLKNGYNFVGLVLEDGGDKCYADNISNINEYGVAMGGAGSDSKRYFYLKVYSPCKLTVSYWVNANETRRVYVKIGDNDPVIDTIGSNNTQIDGKNYKRTFQTDINVSEETIVKIYSADGDMYFYEIGLSN